MTLPRLETSGVHLLRYAIASADMYYAELEQRDVFIGRDEGGQARIWAETVHGGPSTRVELCRIFLEYAMYCATSFGTAEAHYQMQSFGEHLGRRLSEYLRQNPALMPSKNPALGALECLFGTIRARYFEDYAQSGVRFVVTECPLEDTAKRSGIPNLELARYGINAMCQSLCVAMNPGAVVSTLPSTRPEFAFTISLPLAV